MEELEGVLGLAGAPEGECPVGDECDELVVVRGRFDLPEGVDGLVPIGGEVVEAAFEEEVGDLVMGGGVAGVRGKEGEECVGGFTLGSVALPQELEGFESGGGVCFVESEGVLESFAVVAGAPLLAVEDGGAVCDAASQWCAELAGGVAADETLIDIESFGEGLGIVSEEVDESELRFVVAAMGAHVFAEGFALFVGVADDA